MKQKTCSKSSGKRMTAAQKEAKKLASIKKSSHWAVVCRWDGFVPFAQSHLDNELSWAKAQMLGFQKAHLAVEMNGESIYKGAPEEAPAYDARRVVLSVTAEELQIAECDLAVLNGMIAEERKALAKTSSEEGKTLRQKNLARLLEERMDLVHRISSMRAAIRRARTVGGWNWTEWEPVSSVRVTRKAKAKPKAKAKAKPKAKAAAPSAKAEMKARKSREVRLQRVEAAARKAAHEAAKRQLEAAVRKELNKILAERRAKAEAERKAAAAAEKARLEAARKAAAAKRAAAERKAQRARERAEERKLFTSVYNATLRTALSRMVREEVARQLAAA